MLLPISNLLSAQVEAAVSTEALLFVSSTASGQFIVFYSQCHLAYAFIAIRMTFCVGDVIMKEF